jgi:signal transduction histidine kinase/DNA-binding response OmpR family regulator/HAMP domain-containing protein
VRNIAGVATAVAKGDLSQKITVDVRGEILELKNTLNTMVDQLSSFADEVTRVAREVGTEGKLGGQAQVRGVSGVWKDLTDNVNSMASSLTTQVRAIAAVSTAVTQGDLTRSITVEAQGEVDALKDTINQMIANLRETTKRNSEQDWLNSNLARFGGMMQGQRDLRTVSNVIMSELTPLVSAQFGAFFLVNHGEDEEAGLELLATYGYDFDSASVRRVRPGEGLVGQAAVEKKPIFVSNVPEGYLRISSSLGGAPPQNVVVLPALFEDRVMAVIELASFDHMSPVHQAFLEQLTETIGVVINAIEANTRTEELLSQSQTLATELQKQQEELRETNMELAEKATLLAEQNERIEVKNREIEMARLALEEKAEQLALSSQYKSEFLANISHELRTPLNSLLILAKLLADNAEDNLTDKQVEFAKTILASGNDLLELINDILDLSKIEAGRMDVHPGEVSLAEVVDYVDRAFRPLVEQKGLTFDVELAHDLPRVIETDEQRLQQILRNLLSNAVKFTEEGGVGLTITAVEGGSLSFSVRDTGIGIPNDRLGLIFEAFQQADGTTSRRFGGTGLGLSISAEIAKLLGGEIHVESTVDLGSVFTLTMPVDFARREGEPQPETPAVAAPRLAADPAGAILMHPEFDDDRDSLSPSDRVVLIVEDDPTFAAMLLEVAHTSGFKGVVAHRGDTGFSLAHAVRPDAILLDMGLPVMDGSQLLARLKTHPATRETPVHIISGVLPEGSELSADSTLEKPVVLEQLTELFDRIGKSIGQGAARVLVVERVGAADAARTILDSLGGADVTSVRTPKAALAALETARFACIVLDSKLPRGGAFTLLDRLDEQGRLDDTPVVVYESEPLTAPERRRLEAYAGRVTVVAIATPERLLAETSAFLGAVGASTPNGHAAGDGRPFMESFDGKRVLIVDDDIRNVFALTSILEARGMDVDYAENGAAAIELLKASPEIDVVLMDVMMPEMDGYQTMAAIREIPEFASLPIVAVTAKAMKEDRERCIAAGASEYIKKPVDPDELLATIGIWLYSQPVEQEAVPA